MMRCDGMLHCARFLYPKKRMEQSYDMMLAAPGRGNTANGKTNQSYQQTAGITISFLPSRPILQHACLLCISLFIHSNLSSRHGLTSRLLQQHLAPLG